ncbi:MAG: AsmA family protein [Rhodospirillales bacterium]|nr:AsmA family protein [Rhodospirillales bacterium]
MPPIPRRRRRPVDRRRLYWFGGIALAVVLLPVLVLLVAMATIDPNAYKPRIEAAVQQAIGRRLTIGGKLAISFALSPTLVADDVRLANAPNGSRPDMVRLDQAVVQLSLLPLLAGRIEIAQIVLLHPEILLETDAAGRGNWQFGAPASRQPAASSAGAPARPPAAPAESALRLTLHTLHVRDGHIIWHDGQTGRTVAVDVRRVSLTAETAEAPMAIGADFRLGPHDVVLAAQTGSLARLLDPRARAPWPLFATFDLSGAKLTVVGSITEPLAGRGYSLRLDGAVPDLGALGWLSPVALPPLHALTFTARVLDRGGVIPDVSNVTLQAGLTNLDAISPGFTLDGARIDMPGLAEPVVITAEGAYTGTKLRLNATIGAPALFLPNAGGTTATGAFGIDITGEIAGGTLAVRGAIQHPATLTGMDIAVGARLPDLAALSPLAGVALPALHSFAFSARVVDPPDPKAGGVALKGIVLSVPQGDLAGDAALRPGPRPLVTAALHSNRIDLDALMAVLAPPPGGNGGESQAGGTPDVTRPPPVRPASRTVIPDTPLPLAALRLIDADVQAGVIDLKAGATSYRNLAGHLVLRDGHLVLAPFAADVPGGRLDLKLDLDAGHKVPPVALQLHAPQIDIKPLLAAFGHPNAATGRLEMAADLHAAGGSLHAMAASLNGRLGAALSGGDVDNAVLDAALGSVMRLANIAGIGGNGRTALRCAAVTGTARGGEMTIDSGMLDSARLLTTIGGGLDLRAETLALRLAPSLRAGGIDVPVPVRVDGGFRNPRTALGGPGLGGPAARKEITGVLGGLLAGKAPSLKSLESNVAAQRGDPCAAPLAAVRALEARP